MATIFVSRRIPESGLERLQAHHQVDLWPEENPPDRAELLCRVRGCAGILSMLSDRVDAEVLDAAGPALRGVANFAVGFNNIDTVAARKRGVLVGNTPGVLTDATADIAVALMLAAGRCFGPALRNVAEQGWKHWEPLGFLGQEFVGKAVGIVGMGRIGAAVAKRLHHGWGMQILYNARSPKRDAEETLKAVRLPLPELLSQSDVVSIHTSLQPETRGLIDAKALRWMKPSAILVNTARGEVVDQAALCDALATGQIFAAGLDVTDPEPLPPDSPLRALSNCIILPHVGSATFSARQRMSIMAADNLIAAIANQPMPYGVN